MKYKVLFAAVWEEVLDSQYLQEYFSGYINFAELLSALDEPMADLVEGAESLEDLKKIVRREKLFDMND